MAMAARGHPEELGDTWRRGLVGVPPFSSLLNTWMVRDAVSSLRSEAGPGRVCRQGQAGEVWQCGGPVERNISL